MFFKGKMLEQHLTKIAKETKENEKIKKAILNYFKEKSIQDIIIIIKHKDYKPIIDTLKQIRKYDNEKEYHYEIEYVLFKYFTESKNAVEIQFLNKIPDELIESSFCDHYIVEENNQLYILKANMKEKGQIHFFETFEIQTKEMQLTYDFSKEFKQLQNKYNQQLN